MVASNYLRITLYTVFLLYNNDKLLYNADIFRENSEIIDSSLLIFNQHIYQIISRIIILLIYLFFHRIEY